MFDALKNLGNIGDLMKSAQQMQQQMQDLQKELAARTITSDAGGGMVQATVNGRLELIKLKIDKSKIDPTDIDMLEDVIVAAVNAAQSRAADFVKQEMQKKAGEMGLPPGLLGQ
jgi:DNA-binding YbaB/EbfC family protein